MTNPFLTAVPRSEETPALFLISQLGAALKETTFEKLSNVRCVLRKDRDSFLLTKNLKAKESWVFFVQVFDEIESKIVLSYAVFCFRVLMDDQLSLHSISENSPLWTGVSLEGFQQALALYINRAEHVYPFQQIQTVARLPKA